MNPFSVIAGLVDKLVDRVLPDRTKQTEAQSRINEAEVSGAPVSRLRLWRSFLGWVLALVFAWEMVFRTVVATYWPETPLPPTMMKEASALLFAMLGIL